MQLNINIRHSLYKSDKSNWLPSYPNPADFRFDYYKLLCNAKEGLASLNEGTDKDVAIIGAGVAGMTAARELLRCGFNVTIYESSDRIGGRLYTKENPVNNDVTGMELGAMRMPFFPTPGSENCILEYYLLKEAQSQNYKASYAQFPNPGTAETTGIYLFGGRPPGHKPDDPLAMIMWPGGGAVDNQVIKNLAEKAASFINFFSCHIKRIYTDDSDQWTEVWSKIVSHYDAMTFDNLVREPAITNPDFEKGDFGGFGMNDEESRLLYTIGTGDGSWGAFYSIGALWFIRCTMFGFGGAELQTIIGLTAEDTLPHQNMITKDSLGNELPVPQYKGIQSLVEYLFYVPAPGMSASLYEHEDASLYTRTAVKCVKSVGEKIEIATQTGKTESYDYVFVSSGKWASQMSMRFEEFSDRVLPQPKITADHIQHNISSCKLFFPLKEKYWKKEGNRIPQVIVTDTYIQDAYALSWDTSEADTGVILASYTWEDDSLKLLPYDEDRLVELVTEKLSQITKDTLGQDITEYIIKDKPVSIQWITEESYEGCAMLYRQSNQKANQMDLSYNEQYSDKSKLYFIGENYSVEGGWTEPALRSSIDGVLRLLNNVKAKFKVTDFDYKEDYPSWLSKK